MRRGNQDPWRRQRGQSLLETAIMMVLIFTVVFWIIELGALMYTYSVIADAANEGVRYAIVHSGDTTSATQARVAAFTATSLDNGSLSTAVAYPNGATPPNTVKVTVTYSYVPWLSSFMKSLNIQAYAEGRM